MGWLFPLFLLLPQVQPDLPPGLVVTGQLKAGRLPLSALGLGDGGVGQGRVPAGPLGRGQHVTPGGILVQARRQGVKLEFPSGAEVLFTPTGFLHLRSGEQAGRFPNGVELLLADGSSLRVHLASRRLRRVDVHHGNRSIRLWDRKRPVRKLVRNRATTGPQILVLGEGDVFYRAVSMGPLIAMERVLCTEQARPLLPQQHLVILADPLIESLGRLPRNFPRQALDYPDAAGISLVLSQMAEQIFGRQGSSLRRVEAQFLRMALDSGFELSLHLPQVGPPLLSLHRAEEARTLVEWTIGTSTTLRMVRPDGGLAGALRYFRSGISLGDGFDQVAGLRRGFAEQAQGRAILRAMGAVPRSAALAPKRGG